MNIVYTVVDVITRLTKARAAVKAIRLLQAKVIYTAITTVMAIGCMEVLLDLVYIPDALSKGIALLHLIDHGDPV